MHREQSPGSPQVRKREHGEGEQNIPKRLRRDRNRQCRKTRMRTTGGAENNGRGEKVQAEADPLRLPNLQSGGWHGHGHELVPNVRNAVAIHVVEDSSHALRVTNTNNIDCFRVSARVRATGALVFAEVPCTAGSPAVIFRDCPELEPYYPEPVTTLLWVNTPEYMNSAAIMVTTLTRYTRTEQEWLGLVYDKE